MKVKVLSFQAVKVSANQICHQGGATSLVAIQEHLRSRGYLTTTQDDIENHMSQLVKSAPDWQVVYEDDFPVYYRES